MYEERILCRMKWINPCVLHASFKRSTGDPWSNGIEDSERHAVIELKYQKPQSKYLELRIGLQSAGE
jgi:hypothetical protein